MYLVKMRPEQIRAAVERNVPALMAAGSVEWHGPHLPVGTDLLIASAVCEAVERRVECVLWPPMPFAPTLSWAAGPEEGEVDLDPEPFGLYAREVLRAAAGMGFRRIYVLQHHQGAEGLESLCLRRAAAEVVREVTRDWGAGWGRRPDEVLPNPHVFGLVRVAYVDSFSTYPSPEAERIPIGHAGRGETQLVWGAYPETVRLEALDALPELPAWLADARQADPAEGRRWLEFCVQGWARELASGTVGEGASA
jgi:creatinine amidohydrolase